MDKFVRFIDDGTIINVKFKVYEQDGVRGYFHHWEFKDGQDIMVCILIED